MSGFSLIDETMKVGMLRRPAGTAKFALRMVEVMARMTSLKTFSLRASQQHVIVIIYI